ncbi:MULTISPECIES: carbon-nitrogen hydrolase family protein [Microbacterium]|uniref:Carbon-nitrogen hydrolase family protein n=1 Tax=Microbacterium wangchenii TaxID=2541726 RepID=A0ABX5SU51_9MICO|nr:MULTISPECIES: carbon-nitrogen hydrolase family protein [Microbacterium]MCK6064889.1 carbon-nitrogen hydrolase family protein [Microbacterium sp. EYE_512]QBR88374.1 carbon-nitrogen hydrolase family protein [Microbacterium wangchenii]TFV82574.1 carbon-nitrogen hydrolase family protein [Microbacterium sp. dk485]TXK20100.1 carbon-nitrogen hydrolase family protein [Microbacterium wangchenii]
MSKVEPFKAAAIQAEPAWLDVAAGVDKAISLIREAATNGAKLVAFPETWIPGYPHFLWLGPQSAGMAFVPGYHENSIAIGDENFQRLADAAGKHGITVVMGASERDKGSLYMAQFIFGADGSTIATRRKLKPTHVERALFGEGDGSNIAVHDVEGIGRLGALNCWEHLQPLTKYAMYGLGEQVHVASWPSFCLYRGGAYALGEEVNMAASQVYAVEGGAFVLAATTVTGPAGLELFAKTDEQRALLGGGGGGSSRIYGPDGSRLTAPIPEDEEGIVYADIDLSLIPVSKMAADPAGHYARADVTRLIVDRTPRPPVEYIDNSVPQSQPVSSETQTASSTVETATVR